VGAWLFRAAEHSPFVRDRILRPSMRLFIDDAVRAWRKGGVRAWERWHLPLVRAAGRARAEYLRNKLRIDPGSARSLGSIHDYEDPIFGITGHWRESGRERAVRVETACWMGERLRAAGCADFCRVLVHAFEEETLRAMNPRYRLDPLSELISAGDAHCTFLHHVE
jgi:hypothetical protein